MQRIGHPLSHCFSLGTGRHVRLTPWIEIDASIIFEVCELLLG